MGLEVLARGRACRPSLACLSIYRCTAVCLSPSSLLAALTQSARPLLRARMDIVFQTIGVVTVAGVALLLILVGTGAIGIGIEQIDEDR